MHLSFSHFCLCNAISEGDFSFVLGLFLGGGGLPVDIWTNGNNGESIFMSLEFNSRLRCFYQEQSIRWFINLRNLLLHLVVQQVYNMCGDDIEYMLPLGQELF